ncbi:MAG: aspartate kinase [Streptosporangiales bacterium]|nr:aspartate kinase [Streptosporangiales bacterium]
MPRSVAQPHADRTKSRDVQGHHVISTSQPVDRRNRETQTVSWLGATGQSSGTGRAPAVVKYGGSSLATGEQVAGIARAVAAQHRSGHPTVVVVSARGDTTDDLLRLAATAGPDRAGRETDQLLTTGETASAALLAIALEDLGTPACSLTAAQAGIRAAGPHGSGVIADIDTRRIGRVLADGAVPVVAGFQGVGDTGDVITLGRGGSDTTAVALAAVLRAGRCEICTDVPGVSTADPRVVADARVLTTVDVSVMAEMSFAGAKVLHSRAVELAAMHRVELRVRHSAPRATTESGTVIPAESDETMLETSGVVVAIAHDMDVARVLVHCGSRRGDLAADILAMLSVHAVPVDLVARSGLHEEEFRMGFTMRRKDVADTLSTIREAVTGLGADVHVDENVGKVSVIGMGLLNRPQYTARMLTVLATAGIPTSWLSTSQIRTSVVIPLDRVLDAVRLLHDEFELAREDLAAVAVTSA